MLEISSMPLLPGQNDGRAVVKVNSTDLKNVGINAGAFAVHTDDVIEFPEGEPLVVSQPISKAENANKAYYVGVIRNGKNSWLPVGALTRRDASGNPLGSFQEEMLRYPSFEEIYAALAGKKIKGGRMIEHEFAVFENGERTDKTRVRSVCEILHA